MKRLTLVITAVIILLLGVISCANTPQPQTYTSKYTADRVIIIAQAQYPACYKTESRGFGSTRESWEVQTPPSITVAYVGGSHAAWKVQINCPPGYHLKSPIGTSLTLYFYETDGSLRDTYYP